jgi:hypothetical protein
VSLHIFYFFAGANQKKVGLVRGKGHAKNGDKLFWEEKFHAANGKAQAHTECALHFFLSSLGGKQNDQEKGFITFETFPQRIPFDWPKTKFIKEYLASCL